ncbi:alkanesulfonate monooxygenase SsuD/methylene tetrahydromethanopterin reductase-like flavin-dependent oxidoreductase (luciferase family) [Thermocatellispora tengchongensis]|uniref:Alkanesulfonate monooxygenase SsuD/methylene tetrahydromethanopterin reductase-like flavin-dependent oxidoreductase (Luciferase family) n=1 Tax=Thermocatellispora tengchongensis TaxID=1073253 RepID=A0A840PCZ3_9ACTN|nr:LLM class flavin-dependent oxidoreductase [Thermocatellispora tengchongensis]MBB5139284.1 alkanesulfonate monooxygenase SsuD/methylene tetrahydromethanopterin reductase-like flavin-dependent oxidoreductase (luciferase family) [Thermocatellispora tengchongensis]
MNTYSILMPFVPQRPERMLPYAALTQWSAAGRLWQGQAPANDPFQDFTHLAASGFRVPAGIGVTLMALRHPYQAAVQAHELAVCTGHPVVAGFGPGSLPFQRSTLAAPYRSQLGAVREYVHVMRELLGKGEVDHVGEHFTCRSGLGQLPRPPVEIGLGVLRPAMARLAGEVADVAITWLTPAAYIRDTLVPALRAGAQSAGRAMPRIVAMVPLALAGPDRDPFELAMLGSSGHTQLAHYADMLRRSGIQVSRDDPAGNAAALVDGHAFLYGDAAGLTVQLEEFFQAGVDEIVLNVTGVHMRYGDRASLEELDALMEMVTP